MADLPCHDTAYDHAAEEIIAAYHLFEEYFATRLLMSIQGPDDPFFLDIHHMRLGWLED